MPRSSWASTWNRVLAFIFPQHKGGIFLTKHPTPPRTAPNHGPSPGQWLYTGFAAASLLLPPFG